MNRIQLTDDAIRSALALGPEVVAPLDLAGSVRAAVDATPQRRAPWWARLPFGAPARVLILALIVLALVATIAFVASLRKPPALPTAVTSFHGGPARTGVMPGPGPAGSLGPCWPPVALRDQASTFIDPVVVDGTIYVADASGFVTAIDETTGVVTWISTPKVGPILSSPAVSGNLVVAGSDDGALHAFDTSSGALQWSAPAGGPIRSPPTIVDGVAYYGSDDGKLYAIDLATREPRWPAVATGGPVDRAVAIADGLIFAGSGGTTGARFGAYDLATGTPAWPAPQLTGPGQVSTSSVADGRVYVAGSADQAAGPHQLFAFDERTGRRAWPAPFSVPTGTNVFLAAVANGVVYAVSHDRHVYALDEATGAPVWPAPFAADGPMGSVGAFADGTLYVVADDNVLYAIDGPTGTLRWKTTVGGASAAPTVIDGKVIVATSLGQVVCVTGTESAMGGMPTPSR